MVFKSLNTMQNRTDSPKNKTNEVSPRIAQVYCLERYQAMEQ